MNCNRDLTGEMRAKCSVEEREAMEIASVNGRMKLDVSGLSDTLCNQQPSSASSCR